MVVGLSARSAIIKYCGCHKLLIHFSIHPVKRLQQRHFCNRLGAETKDACFKIKIMNCLLLPPTAQIDTVCNVTNFSYYQHHQRSLGESTCRFYIHLWNIILNRKHIKKLICGYDFSFWMDDEIYECSDLCIEAENLMKWCSQ